MGDSEPRVGVRVAAAVPLLRAALEHAVTAAGLRLIPYGQAAPATLRTADQPATGAPCDIIVDGGQVTIAVTHVPDQEVWAATFRLLHHLLQGD